MSSLCCKLFGSGILKDDGGWGFEEGNDVGDGGNGDGPGEPDSAGNCVGERHGGDEKPEMDMVTIDNGDGEWHVGFEGVNM